MAVAVAVETGGWLVGALLFPFELCLAVLLKTNIITGSFALLPCATADGQAKACASRVPRCSQVLPSTTHAAQLPRRT